MGPGTDMTRPARSLFRKNDLDEMTVGRTEKPLNTTGTLPAKPDVAKSTKRFSPLTEGQPEKRSPGDTSSSSSGPSSPSSSGPSSQSSSGLSPPSSSGLTRGSTADDPRPLVRAKAGVGSYEDAGDVKRQKKTKGKTGRPGK